MTDVRPSGGPGTQAGGRVSRGERPGEVIRPKLCSEHPHGEKGLRKCAPCFVETPELGGRGCSEWRSGTLPGGPPNPHPRPGSWAVWAGRRSGSRLGRTESSFMNVFTKKRKKKMSVNCVMKLKPLVLNEKYGSGPRPPQGPGAPGVCREQLDSGVQGGDQGPARGGGGTALLCPSEGWLPPREEVGSSSASN